MISELETRQWFSELLLQGERVPAKYLHTETKSDWMNSIRQQAKSSLGAMKMPSRRDEIWRYSNMDKLFANQFKMPDETSTAVLEPEFNDYNLPGLDSYQIVIINGRCVSDSGVLNGLPEAVTISSLRDVLLGQTTQFATWFGQTAQHQQHVFSALNTALMNDGVFIHIAAGIKLSKPIEIIYLNLETDTPLMIQPRNLVVMDKDASATLIERYLCTNGSDSRSEHTGESFYFNNNLTEIVLQDNAALSHYRTQEESKQSYHMGSIFISQMAESEYNNTTFATGGHWARTDINVDFKGQSARCNLNGLYTVGEQQLIDFHTRVQHSVPNCCSQENFKGILYGKGRAVFDGHIIVDKDAQGTDAHMSNANLLLTRKAEVDTKPQLEIYADDVKCSHGTTVGQLEPEQIFYLRSRGIEESAAKKMLCQGFAAEVINTIEIQCVADKMTGKLQEQILL
ncbi:MAG: Fe-S cluster assembly protein SufD [Gammaproteobacteria bacterium]|nr:Fe-S cluster assembly protein SufD [Gammaproteobacteria bacterium]